MPVDQTVEEGGDATFACSGTVDDTAQPTRYRIRSGATVLQSVGANISDLVAVSGIDAALVFGEFSSQLLLSGITREANGYTVTCAIRVGAIFQEAINAPPAHITVTCKYHITVSIYVESFPLCLECCRPQSNVMTHVQENTRQCVQWAEFIAHSNDCQCCLTCLHPDPPTYSVLPNQPTIVLEGEDFTYSFGFDARPTPTNFTWSRDGQVISSGTRIATSVSNITITSTTRSDSGVYEVVSYNEAGRGAANFTLDVQCEPLLVSFHVPIAKTFNSL